MNTLRRLQIHSIVFGGLSIVLGSTFVLGVRQSSESHTILLMLLQIFTALIAVYAICTFFISFIWVMKKSLFTNLFYLNVLVIASPLFYFLLMILIFGFVVATGFSLP